MRIRSIKPEFWRSLDIAALSIEDRLLFIGLWSYVDDNGVGVDRVPIIAAELFADDLSRDPRETLGRVSDGIGRLSECGLVQRYSDSSRDYLAVTNWERHQRIDKPNKPRYPLPTSENVTIRETLATPSRNSRETPAPGTGEQGNRGTESSPDGERVQSGSNRLNEPPATSEYPAAFERWWATYPRKQGKRKALAEWRRATKRIGRDELVTKTKTFATFHAREGTDKQFIPLPTTWLNRDGWDDELISRNPQNTWANVANSMGRKYDGDIVEGEVVGRKELPF